MSDTLGYTNPSIIVQEIPSPVIGTTGIAPTVVGIVGDSQRARSYSQTIVLSSDAPVALEKTGIDDVTIVVRNRFTGVVYAPTDDYVVTEDDGVTSVARELDGDIPDGTSVIVTYQYTDADYFIAREFTAFGSVADMYGSPLTPDGVINSPVSLAAYLAFMNGAERVIIAPINSVSTDPSQQEWEAALDVLTGELSVNVIVPVTGDTGILDIVRARVTNQASQGILRRAFLGLDGSSSSVSNATFRSTAPSWNNSRVSLVGPDTGTYFTGVGGGRLRLGGQYLAAAVAGAFASRPVQEPLTHKQIQGFENVTTWTETELIQAQEAGVLVLAKRRQGGIIVRHGLTTQMTSIYTRELSVQAGKDRIHTLIKDTLAVQELIGSNMTPTTPQQVVGAVTSALEFAVSTGLIYSYSGIQWRIPTNSPTTVEVKFQYRPTLPLNNLVVGFAIDTAAGTAEFSDDILVAA